MPKTPLILGSSLTASQSVSDPESQSRSLLSRTTSVTDSLGQWVPLEAELKKEILVQWLIECSQKKMRKEGKRARIEARQRWSFKSLTSAWSPRELWGVNGATELSLLRCNDLAFVNPYFSLNCCGPPWDICFYISDITRWRDSHW